MLKFDESLLRRGAEQQGLVLADEVVARMLDFLRMLSKWNRIYNLTAITEPKQMVTHHLLDSLAVAPFLQGQRILDVGTGAGLPGIPLALCFPDRQFVLLDSAGKKVRFLVQAVSELGITNVEPVHARVEEYTAEVCFDTIIARAFTRVNDMIEKTQHLCCDQGVWLAMKGGYPQQELAALRHPYQVHQLDVPSLGQQRHLVVVENNDEK